MSLPGHFRLERAFVGQGSGIPSHLGGYKSQCALINGMLFLHGILGALLSVALYHRA